MNHNNLNPEQNCLKEIHCDYLRITAIPVFIAMHVFLVIHIPEQKSTLEWGTLFLISVFLSSIVTAAYSILVVLVESLISTSMINGHKTKEMLFISKPKAQFKIVQHTKKSQIKHVKENRTKYHERNNRTIRRIINTRSKKK